MTSRSQDLLHRTGTRLMKLDGQLAVGIWADVDSQELRIALRILGLDQLPVAYLDGSGIPDRYKLRRVRGTPVPLDVLTAMRAAPGPPWVVRDEMLKNMEWQPRGWSWHRWWTGFRPWRPK